jgi:hypothetical protein
LPERHEPIQAQQLHAFAAKSKTDCLGEQSTLFCVRFRPKTMPNAIQIQFRTLFGGYDDGWALLRDLLEE